MAERAEQVTFPELCEGFEQLPSGVRKFFRLHGAAITEVRQSVGRLEEANLRNEKTLQRIEGWGRKIVWGLLAGAGSTVLTVAWELLRAVH